MKIVSHTDADYAEQVAAFSRRARPRANVEKVVTEVVAAVRERGDAALLELARRFDGVDFADGAALRVGAEEAAAATAEVDETMREAIALARANVEEFARRSMRRDWSGSNAQGAEVGERYHPFERVGVYVPGGSAPLVSSANMTVGLAAAAGVPEIVVCTPSNAAGQLNPVLLYALCDAGATEVYKLGGSQAIAAMALGTATVAPVAKVFGPGNAYVVEAKRQVFGAVGVDLLPGPSEILVLSDGGGKAAWIAADMLAQAEHGADSEVGLLTDSPELLEAVRGELEAQAPGLSRQQPVRAVLEHGCTLVLVADLEEGVALVNAYAPEHLSLISDSADALLPTISTAGAIFIGNYSPVAAGDFLAGPSHELPTGGAGKSFAGLTVDQFQRRTSVVRYDQSSIDASAAVIETFAAAEGLDAHGRSATLRRSK
ncbi:MAG: histidinol dehydrogenase [Verrucomicrobiales bacterium]